MLPLPGREVLSAGRVEGIAFAFPPKDGGDTGGELWRGFPVGLHYTRDRSSTESLQLAVLVGFDCYRKIYAWSLPPSLVSEVRGQQ